MKVTSQKRDYTPRLDNIGQLVRFTASWLSNSVKITNRSLILNCTYRETFKRIEYHLRHPWQSEVGAKYLAAIPRARAIPHGALGPVRADDTTLKHILCAFHR